MTNQPVSFIAEIISGGTPKTSIDEYWNGPIPWLSVKDFNTGNKYVYTAEKSITELGLDNSAANLLNKDDIIISARGTVGAMAKLARPMAFNQSCFGLRAKTGIDQDYLYYALKNKVAELSALSQGSVFSTINRASFAQWSIPIPTFEKQTQIANLLSILDEKIATSNRLNDYLAKLRNILVKEKISNALERGEGIWRVVPLKEVALIQSGYSYKSAELVESSSIGMIGIKNFNRNGSFRNDGFKPLEPIKAKPSQYVSLGEIVVAHTDLTQNADIIGRAIQVIDAGGYDQMVASCDLVKVTSSETSISNEFLAALLGTQDFHNHCLGYVNGTTVLHLGKKALPEYQLKIPEDESLMAELDDIFKSIADQQAALIRENRNLEQLRDTLLPKLMSGEIDVSKVDITQLNNHSIFSDKVFISAEVIYEISTWRAHFNFFI